MQKSIKAALYSALIFPGCGHFLLRCYRTGLALLAITLVALGVILNYAMTQAHIIADQILANELPLDPVLIAERVSAATHGGDSPANHLAMSVLIVCWIIGIIDSYRVGRRDSVTSSTSDKNKLKFAAPPPNLASRHSIGSIVMTAPIPSQYLDLLQKTAFAHLTTLMPDGSPQVSPVWCDFDGTHVIINSAKGRQKDRNMRRDPRVALALSDPENPYRYLQVRGKVIEVTETGADAVIEKLSQKYLGKAYPFRQPGEVRVTYRIEPEHVSGSGS